MRLSRNSKSNVRARIGRWDVEIVPIDGSNSAVVYSDGRMVDSFAVDVLSGLDDGRPLAFGPHGRFSMSPSEVTALMDFVRPYRSKPVVSENAKQRRAEYYMVEYPSGSTKQVQAHGITELAKGYAAKASELGYDRFRVRKGEEGWEVRWDTMRGWVISKDGSPKLREVYPDELGPVPMKKYLMPKPKRSKRAETIDSKRRARTTFPRDCTADQYNTWAANPGRYDIQGIDTPRSVLPGFSANAKPSVYTMDDWARDRRFSAEVGQEVSSEVYAEMQLNGQLRDAPRGVLKDGGCVRGFVTGNAFADGPRGEPLYGAFGETADGRFVYLGLSKAGRYDPKGPRTWDGAYGRRSRCRS